MAGSSAAFEGIRGPYVWVDDPRPNVANPWGIIFPAVADMDNAVLRALLRCVSCERTEVTYLNELKLISSLPPLYLRCANSCGAGLRGIARMTIPRGTYWRCNPWNAKPTVPRPHSCRGGWMREASHSGTKLWLLENWRAGGLSFFSIPSIRRITH